MRNYFIFQFIDHIILIKIKKVSVFTMCLILNFYFLCKNIKEYKKRRYKRIITKKNKFRIFSF